MNFQGVRKVLVIKLRHIGDVLLTVPVFRALREHFPNAHIAALVNSGTEEVLRGNPLIDEILLFERKIKELSPLKLYLKEIQFLKEIRRKGFDMAIDLTGGDRAAILSLVSGARYRVGWREEKGFPGKKWLYTHLSRPEAKNHMVLQNLEVVSRFGIDTRDLSVNFHIPEHDRARVTAILRERKIMEGEPIVHIHPTSRWLFKCWKDEYMAEVILWLLSKGMAVVLTSSPERREMEKAERILFLVGTHQKLINLCGNTTIKQLGAVAQLSTLFFGVDSAPMHIAAAVGTPVIALFGPSGPHSWRPWNNSGEEREPRSAQELLPEHVRGVRTYGQHTTIQRGWDCVPCGRDGCNGSKVSRCLEDIRVDEVRAVIEEKLKGIGK